MMEPFLAEANTKVQNALNHLKQELASIRAGRANPSLIENIPVSVYGAQMKLLEVGTISAPQSSLLQVLVWDVSIIKDVEKALLEANLGINPSVDGQIIRLSIPPLTEERREEFVRLASQKGEEGKVAIRQIRADEKKKWEQELKSGEFGEDELERREKILQELVDKSVTQIEELVKMKKEELGQI